MKTRLAPTALSVLVGFLALAARSQTGTLSGSVTDATDLAPLEGISVEAYRWQFAPHGSYWESAGRTQTGPDGSYEFSLNEGSYRVTFVDNNGFYLSQVYDGFVGSWPGDGGDDIYVAAGASLSGINAALSPGASITGTVTALADGLPLSEIYVTAYRWNGEWWSTAGWTSTGGDGTYEIAGLPAGTYRVGFFSGDRYVSQIYGDSNSQWVGFGGTDLTLASGDTVNDIDAAMLEYATLSGRVTEADGVTPIANARVFLPDAWLSPSTRSNENGEFSITRIPPGTYPVLAEPPAGSGFLALWYDAVLVTTSYWEGAPDEATRVSLDSGEHVQGVDFALPRPARILGRIVGDGAPIASARAKVRNVSRGQTFYAKTDSEGHYAVGGLLPGDVQVKAEAHGYQDEWWQDANHEDFAQTVSIEFGDERSFDFDLSPGQSPAYVEVTSDEPGAAIFIDLQPTGQVTPAMLDLGQLMPVASHSVLVSVRKQGFALPGVQWTEAVEAETHRAHFDMVPALSPETGSVRVVTDPEVGADIFIDYGDAPAGITPVTVGNLMTDYHTLLLRAPAGYLQPAPIHFSVWSGEVTEIVVPMHPLDSDADRLTIEVASDPDGADIHVDYLPSALVTGATVDWLDAIPHSGDGWHSASHTILLRKPGYRPTTAYPVPGVEGVHQLGITLMREDNLPPARPEAVSPSDGQAAVSITPGLQASDFADPNEGDTHAASQWQVARDAGFDNLAWDSGKVEPGDTRIDVPEGVLEQQTDYWWQVRYADDRDAWSAWSAAYKFTTLTLPPEGTPTPLAPTGDVFVTRRPAFSWTGVPDATWYQLVVTWANGTHVLSQWTQQTAWTPGSDMALGEYLWQVRAWNAAGLGELSEQVAFSIRPNAPSHAPFLIQPEQNQAWPGRRPVFEWDAVERATWYRLIVQRNGSTFADQWVKAETFWTPAADWPGDVYTCWIVGWGPDGFGPWSEVRTFRIEAQTPGFIGQSAPHGEQAGNDLNYQWTVDADATWYHLWVGHPRGGAWHNRWYPDSGLDLFDIPIAGHPAGDFVWWVRGWGPDGYGPWTGPMAFTTPSRDPAKPVLTSPQGVLDANPPIFTWEASARTDWYRLYVQRGPDRVFDRWFRAADGAQWTAPDALAMGGYSWWIGAWNGDTGRTTWSESETFVVP